MYFLPNLNIRKQLLSDLVKIIFFFTRSLLSLERGFNCFYSSLVHSELLVAVFKIAGLY